MERDNRLPRGPEPDIGFSQSAYGWASGRPLSEVLADGHLTAGDFVRWAKQTIDILDQLRGVHGLDPALRDTAHEAIESVRRGVVEYSVFEQ